MTLLNKEILALASDVAQGQVQNYSAADGSEVIRQAMKERFGSDKLTHAAYREHKNELFAFIESVITPIVNDRTKDVFGQFAEFKNISLGDKEKFRVTDRELFPVNTISLGNGNVTRHRLDSDEFEIEMGVISVGTYEELILFMAGRTDWPTFIQRAADSIVNDIYKRIAEAFAASVKGLTGVYKASVASSSGLEVVRENALSVADHVEAANGAAMLVGTKAALRKLKPEFYSDAEAGARNAQGYFGLVDGYQVFQLPQFHKNGSDEFALNDDQILVLPAFEKLVKVALGETFVREANGSENNRQDMQMQHDVITTVGVSVITASKFGVVELS